MFASRLQRRLSWLIILGALALCASVASKADRAPRKLVDATRAYCLVIGEKTLVIERCRDGVIVATYHLPRDSSVVAGWDPQRPSCLVWIGSPGEGKGEIWGWRPREENRYTCDLPAAMVPIADSQGASPWKWAPGGASATGMFELDVSAAESAPPSEHAHPVCIHPWTAPGCPGGPSPGLHLASHAN